MPKSRASINQRNALDKRSGNCIVHDADHDYAGLIESENRFRSLFEQVPAVAVQGYDCERRVIFWNHASEKFYGYSAAEALGRRIEDLIIPAAMREHVLHDTRAWIEDGIPIPAGELVLRDKHGRPVPVFSSHALLRNAQGALELYCIDVDLSEQKQALDKLERSEARYREVVDSVSDVIFQADAAGRWTFLNRAWAQLTGYAIADCLHRPCTDLVYPEDRERLRDCFEQLNEHQQAPQRVEVRLTTRDGQVRWMAFFSRAATDGPGGSGAVVGTISDVTDRVQFHMLQETRAEVLRRVVVDDPVTDVIRGLITSLETMRPLMRIAVMLYDADAGCLGRPIAPSLPDAFAGAVEGMVPGPDVGSCGAAAWSGKTVIVEDTLTHPNWAPWRELVRGSGLRACWSRPLRDEAGHVLGTFSVYHAMPHVPDVGERQLIDEFADLTCVALQKQRAEETVRQRESDLEMSAAAVLQLLREPDLGAGLQDVLADIGQRMKVDRVYAFEMREVDEDGPDTVASPRFEWVREGLVPHMGREAMSNLSFRKLGFTRWLDRLAVGKSIVGHVQDFPASERAFLEPLDVCSQLVVPIFHEQRLWGFVGFDAVVRRRYWRTSEEHVLRILAASISAAIERNAALDKLRLMAAAFESSRDGVVVTGLDGSIVAVNPAYADITGFSEAEVLGRNSRLLHSGRQVPEFYSEMWRTLLSRGHWEGEIWNRHKNGEIYPQWLNISTVRDAAGQPTHYVGVMTDISRLKRSEEELQWLAHYDPLTELPNRVLVRLRLEHAIEQARRHGLGVAVLFIDLDRFKNVNDSFGHPVGDELLIKVAERLRSRVRAEDTLSRLGGDEFLLVLEHLERADQARAVAQALLQTLHDPFELTGASEVYLGASIGISLFPEDGGTPTELIQHADAALYLAKAEGRSTYRFFTAALSAAAHRRIELETRLRRAQEREEFELYYQPKVDVATGQVVGCEALMRWNDPAAGITLPEEFIPVAEETGLIVPMGEWALRTACEQMRRWMDQGLPPMHVAVNLSGRQLWQPNIAERVGIIIRETGVPADMLEFELTESTLLGQEELADERLRALKRLGVSLALDDFGTGYSSLAYLKRYPIDVLKIDREFVRDIPEDAEDMEIAVAIVAMAHALNMKVVAEGVETQAQWDFMRRQRCDLCQGYLFSPPLDAAAFARYWLESR